MVWEQAVAVVVWVSEDALWLLLAVGMMSEAHVLAMAAHIVEGLPHVPWSASDKTMDVVAPSPSLLQISRMEFVHVMSILIPLVVPTVARTWL